MDGLFNPSNVYSYLKDRGMLPEWYNKAVEGSMGTYGQDSNRLYAVPVDNLPKYQRKEARDTLAHELTHANQFNLLLPAFEFLKAKNDKGEKLNKEEKQYLEGALKLLSYDSESPYYKAQQEMTKDRMSPDYAKYRLDPIESMAFGVGSLSREGKALAELTHLDATRASDFSILSDLYNKLPQSTISSLLDERKAQIQEDRKIFPPSVSAPFVDVFSDPFASSIR